MSFRDIGSVLQAVHAYKLADVEMISLIREEPSRLGVVVDLWTAVYAAESQLPAEFAAKRAA
jgi:hypothetical protein